MNERHPDRAALTQKLRLLLTLGVLLAVASPVLRGPTEDSFPLSTYPMFARVIEHPWLTVAEGLDARGTPVRLPPELVASDEPMQAMRTLSVTAGQGRRALRQLCARIAERVARAERFAPVESVRIVRARFNPLAYFEGNPKPEAVKKLSACQVSREN
jgi:hypothetical protein